MIAPTERLDELDVLSLVQDAQRGDREAMEQLCVHYRPWVTTIAMHLHTRAMELEDLIQEGMIGLLGAIESYDMRKGAALKSRVFIRTRGAMIDAIRQYGGLIHVPRAAIQKGAVRLNRKSMKYTPKDGEQTEMELGREYVPDVEQLEDLQFHLVGVDQEHREMLEAYFFRERTMKQIGDDYRISESRVSQIISRALDFIRARKEESLKPPLTKPGRK